MQIVVTCGNNYHSENEKFLIFNLVSGSSPRPSANLLLSLKETHQFLFVFWLSAVFTPPKDVNYEVSGLIWKATKVGLNQLRFY